MLGRDARGGGCQRKTEKGRTFQNVTPPTFLEELFESVLERLQILLWWLLTHHCHLFLTCCEEKVAVRLPREHGFAELVLYALHLGINSAKSLCIIVYPSYRGKSRNKQIISSLYTFLQEQGNASPSRFFFFFLETRQNLWLGIGEVLCFWSLQNRAKNYSRTSSRELKAQTFFRFKL